MSPDAEGWTSRQRHGAHANDRFVRTSRRSDRGMAARNEATARRATAVRLNATPGTPMIPRQSNPLGDRLFKTQSPGALRPSALGVPDVIVGKAPTADPVVGQDRPGRRLWRSSHAKADEIRKLAAEAASSPGGMRNCPAAFDDADVVARSCANARRVHAPEAQTAADRCRDD